MPSENFMLYQASLESATSGLLHTLFQIFLALLLIRFLLPLVRANYFNPISQFIVRLTDPLLKPLRKILPTMGRVDVAALVLLIALQAFEGWLQSQLLGLPIVTNLLVYALLTLVRMLLGMYLVLIIAAAILSWFAHNMRHPILPFLHDLTDPVLRPIRSILPTFSGIDLSPLLAILAIQFLIRLLGW